MREKALADEADEQCCQEEAARAAVSAEMALAKEQHHHEAAYCAMALATKALAKERCRQESADRAVVLVECTLANKRHCREAAEHARALAELALAKDTIVERQRNALRHWQSRRWPRNAVAESRRNGPTMKRGGQNVPTMNRGGRNASLLSPAWDMSRNGLRLPRPRNVDNRKRPQLPTQSSCGFAAVASLLPACNMSRNCLYLTRPRSLDNRRSLLAHLHWPTSIAAMRRTSELWHWQR
jgi:hypothetical protein